MKTERRVWVGLEGSYAAGRLVGRWVDAEDCTDDGVSSLLAELRAEDPEGGEELSIFDSEGWGAVDPKAFALSHLADVAEVMDDLGPALHAYVEHVGSYYHRDAASLREGFESVMVYGPYKDLEEFGYEYADGLGIIKGPLKDYVDWEAYGRDLAVDGSVVEVDGETFVIFG